VCRKTQIGLDSVLTDANCPKMKSAVQIKSEKITILAFKVQINMTHNAIVTVY